MSSALVSSSTSARSLLSTLRGQPAAKASLLQAISTEHVPPVLLFAGAEGVGKEHAAFGLAQALLCPQAALAEGHEACGVCTACTRVVLQPGEPFPRHPDLVILERGLYEPSLLGRRTPEVHELSLDQVRAVLLSRISFPPHEGRAKVFLMRRAEELSLAATHALLKTLEELPPRFYVMLLSAVPDILPATVRSRAQHLRFAPLPEQVLVELLVQEGMDLSVAEKIASQAQGSLATARRLADPEALAAAARFHEKVMEALQDRSLTGVLALSEEAKKEKGGLVQPLHALAHTWAAQGRARMAAGEAHAEALFVALQSVLDALKHLDAHANPQLTLESMLLRIRASRVSFS